MKAKEYQKRKDENLAQWVERLAADVMWNRIEPETIHDILSEVSVTSYIDGVNAEREVSAKFGGRIK